MKNGRARIIAGVTSAGVTICGATPERFTFFYGGPFSQWADAPFTVGNIRYRTAEHYMMWFKDQVFGGRLEQQILDSVHPSVAKHLGRTIEGFDARRWRAVAKQGVYRGNIAKFTQNPSLLAELMRSCGTTLVEASETDPVWGIGLGEDDPRRFDRAKWLGTNWLGEVLEDVRETLALVCGHTEAM